MLYWWYCCFAVVTENSSKRFITLLGGWYHHIPGTALLYTSKMPRQFFLSFYLLGYFTTFLRSPPVGSHLLLLLGKIRNLPPLKSTAVSGRELEPRSCSVNGDIFLRHVEQQQQQWNASFSWVKHIKKIDSKVGKGKTKITKLARRGGKTAGGRVKSRAALLPPAVCVTPADPPTCNTAAAAVSGNVYHVVDWRPEAGRWETNTRTHDTTFFHNNVVRCVSGILLLLI